MNKIAALTLLALTSAALAQNQTIRIVVVTHGQASDPFWSVVKNGVEQGAKDMNVRVEYRSPQTFDMVQMSQLINAAVASKPDGIVVSIPDPAALSKAITAATKAGIPVVSINSGADAFKKLGVMMHVGQEEFAAGRGAGLRMKALGVKNPICLNQEVGNAGLDQRCAGFSEGFGKKVPVVAVKTDFTEVRNAVANYLQRNSAVDGVMALGPVASEPALQAVNASRRKVTLATFDLSTAVLNALRDGKMAFAIDQQQYLQGYLPVVILTNYKRYGLLPANDVIATGPGFVTAQNAAQVIDLTKRGIR